MVEASEPQSGEGGPLANRRRAEDTAHGCRALADADRERAADMVNDHMRGAHERSADAWTSRADLLERLELSSNARAAAYLRDKDDLREEGDDNGQGTGSVEQGKTQAEGGQEEKGAGHRAERPRIKGLSATSDRKDQDAD